MFHESYEIHSKQKTHPLIHRLIWWGWLPITFIWAVIILYYRTKQWTFQYGEYYQDNTLLTAITIVYFAVEAFFVISPVVVFVGFFKNRKYAYYLLMAKGIGNILSGVIIIAFNNYDAASILGKLIRISIEFAIVFYYYKHRNWFLANKNGTGRQAAPLESPNPICYPSELKIYIHTDNSYCHQCGAIITEDSNFCSKCGTKIIKE